LGDLYRALGLFERARRAYLRALENTQERSEIETKLKELPHE